MNKLEILEQLPFYRPASGNFKYEMESAATYVQFDAGKVLFLEGDDCHQVGFVGRGNIRVSKIGESGREVTLYHVHPGEGCVLNISCAFAEIGYPATATIESDTDMILFSAQQFREWMSKTEIRSFVFELFSRRLTQIITLIEEVIFRKMDHRLAEFLSEKFQNNGRPRTRFRITQEKIASELGTAREVVNRLLKEMEREGAVESTRGAITLKNEIQLKTFLR